MIFGEALKSQKWLRNLPGFGPVAMASDGMTAVAFMNTHNLNYSLFKDFGEPPENTEIQYHLMLLNTQTMKFHSIPLGDTIPRYTLTPDGQVVLIDYSDEWSSYQDRIRILDVKTRTLNDVTGPRVMLDHFSVSPNSKDVYLLYQADLYWLSIPERKVTYLETPEIYKSMNIMPDGERLLLIDFDDTLHLYDIPQQNVIYSMKPPVIKN